MIGKMNKPVNGLVYKRLRKRAKINDASSFPFSRREENNDDDDDKEYGNKYRGGTSDATTLSSLINHSY